jgi:hypothetical protein
MGEKMIHQNNGDGDEERERLGIDQFLNTEQTLQVGPGDENLRF